MNQPETTDQPATTLPAREEFLGIPFYVFKLMLAGLLLYIMVMTVGFAFGIFPTEEPSEPAAMVMAALFGAVFSWLGGWLIWSACNTIFELR